MSERKFLNAFQDKEKLVLLFRSEDGILMKKGVEASHIAYFKDSDLSPDIRRKILHHQSVLGAEIEGEWLRVSFRSGYWDPEKPNKWRPKPGAWVSYREEMCKRWEKEFGLKSYEADVSPIRRLFADTGNQISRPRRCYLDIETDSRVPINQAKEGQARVLCWAIVSDETGEQFSGMLSEDTDRDENRILSEMWSVADRFDQIVALNGDAFDFPVKIGRAHV